MPPRDVVDPVAALTLRAWMLRALADPAARDVRALDAVAACTPATWDLVLRVERCALALRSALADVEPAPLPPPIASLLKNAATVELRRNLSALMQLRMLGELAREHGWRVVALKGAVAAAARIPIDVSDIDVVTHPDHAPALAAALDARGYAPYGAGSRSHLAARLKPGGIQIEVHHALALIEDLPAFLNRAVPLDSIPGLFVPAPADHLWHLLVHSVLYHPDRRGRIRDLLLIRHAAVDAPPDAVRVVERRIAAHADAAPLRAALAMARELDHPPGPSERFARITRDKYFLACQRFPLPRGHVRRKLLAHTASFLDGTTSLANQIRRVATAPVMDPTTIRPIAWLMRYAPRIGGLCRRLMRMIQVLVCYVVVRTARRRAQRVLPLPPVSDGNVAG